MADVKTLYCSKCHVFIAHYVQDKTGTQFLKNGKPIGIRSLGMTFIIDGKKYLGTPQSCPRGHINVVKDTPEQVAEGVRKEYFFGKICAYNDKPDMPCIKRRPCQAEGSEFKDDCLVYQNYDKKVAVCLQIGT